jgi:long-subunit fatty acid transport protein
MKTPIYAAITLGLSAVAANAGGLDRSGQWVNDIFQTGSVAKFSYSSTTPTLSGTDTGTAGLSTGNVGQSFSVASGSYKTDLNDSVSVAVIWDQPFGSSVYYEPTQTNTPTLGINAQVSSNAVTGVLRYKLDSGISFHGGLRAQQVEGNVALPFAGNYTLDLVGDTGFGYLAGVAYERPDIALRVSLTYNSEIDHSFASVDSTAGNVTTSTSTPESWNLEFQSGVAANMLVFGSVRYTPWGDFKLPAAGLGGLNIASLSNSTDYTLGVGRKLNDTWSISAVYGQSGGGTAATASALSPTGGNKSLALAAVYTKDAYKITTGVRYTKLGDTTATVGAAQTPVASFSGNSAVSVGVSVAYTF